jgi:hypothetical protein
LSANLTGYLSSVAASLPGFSSQYKQGRVDVWVRLREAGGTTYVSTGTTDGDGKFTLNSVLTSPSLKYYVEIGPTNTGPWTVLDANNGMVTLAPFQAISTGQLQVIPPHYKAGVFDALANVDSGDLFAVNPPFVNGLDDSLTHASTQWVSAPLIPQSNTPTKPVSQVRDDFHRADTVAGQVGSSIRIPPWRLSGAGFASAKITSNQLVDTAGVVYAFQRFWAAPYVMRATVCWVPGPGASTADSTIALISSLDFNLIFNMVHCIFNQHTMTLQKRIANGSFVTVAGPFTYPTPAASDGTLYGISVTYGTNAAGAFTGTVTMTGPDGSTLSATDPDFITYAGKWCTWELLNDGSAKAESRFTSASADLPAHWSPRSFREVILGETPAPLCYWPMDDMDSISIGNGSIPMDNSGANLYYGSIQTPNDVNTNAAGLIVGDLSTAYTFGGGGAGLINCGNAVAQQLTTGTMEIWINTTDRRTGDHGIFGKYNAWLLEMVSGVLKFRDFTAGALRDTGVFIADGQLHQIAATFVSGGASQTLVYVDGRLVLTTTSTVLNQATQIQIMAATGTWQSLGTVQHAALTASVLTPAQILAHYNAGRDVS